MKKYNPKDRKVSKGDRDMKNRPVSWIILVVLTSVCSYTTMANAQAAILVLLFGDKVASENFYFSLKAGGNWANLSGIENTSSYSGFNFGVMATIKLNDKFYLVPEFMALSPKGASDIPLRDTGNSSLDLLLQNPTHTSREMNYLDIPVVLKFLTSRRPKLSIGAGPQFSILTSAHDRFQSNIKEDNDLTFEDNIKSQLNTFEFGVVFDVTYSLWKARNGKGLDVHARYALGLTDTIKDNPGDAVKNSLWQLSLSFPFISDKQAKENKN